MELIATGEVVPKYAPHRPGTAPALGLRAGRVAVAIIEQTTLVKETTMWFRSLLDSWLARSSRSPVSRIRRMPNVRPRLEILEDRTLLSTYTVNALTDTGTGSGLSGDLRYCLTNATSGSDTITFAQGLTGTINISEYTPLPTLNASVAIQGPGANQINVTADTSVATYSSALFSVGMGAYVQISGLTIANSFTGYAIDNSGKLLVNNCTLLGNTNSINNQGSATVSNSSFSRTGALLNSGTLTVADSTFDGCGGIENSAAGSATISYSTLSDGYQAISNAGTMTVNNSTISGDRAYGMNSYWQLNGTYPTGGTITFIPATNGMGGGIYMAGGTVTINNSTIADNEAIGGSTDGNGGTAGNGLGGGLYIAGGTVTINNSTFAGNQAITGKTAPVYGGSPGVGYGGGIDNAAGPGALQIYDTIVADNTGSAAPDLYGSVTSQGHNLIGNTNGSSGFTASDLLNVNPQLGQLQNNGGPTQTMALLPGSPAINAGDNTNAPAYDQRGPGFARIVGGTIDIGAFENQSSSTQASSLAVTGFPSTITAGNSGSFTVTALNADGSTDTNYTGTVHFTSSDPLALLPANYTFTTADAGVHTFSATLKTAGNQSITATDTTTGSVTGSDTGITVTPAAASQLVFGQQPSTTTAGQTISPAVTVDVEDPYGNRVTSDSSTVTVTLSSGTFASGSATVSAAASSGVATFAALQINKAGSYTLKATDGTLASATSGTFSIQPAAASTLSVTGFPTSTTAGVAHTFTVTLRDPYGNIATGYTGTVHFTSSDHKAVLPANYTFTAADAGIHTFSATLKTAGTQSIMVADTTTTSLKGTEGGIKVNPAVASKFLLAAPASVSAGVAFSLTVTAEDAYGNVVVGYTGTLHFSSTDSQATLPANYTFTTANAGVHTFTGLVLRKKGYQTISVTDTHNSALKGSTIVDVL